MSAVNLHQGAGSIQAKPAPSTESRAYEPSMEEILASIRRIIADDQSLPSRGTGGTLAPATVHTGTPTTEPAAPFAPVPVVMLHAAPQGTGVSSASHQPAGHEPQGADEAYHDMHEHGSISAPQFPSPDGTGADLHGHSDAYAEPEAAGATDAAPGGPDDETEASEAIPALFSTSTDHSVTAAFNTLAATRLADNSEDLLDLARDMIRPLLKTWLDDNLPSMVERMVRAEIERVARGGR